MTKAVRNMKNDLRLVDLVFELRDARVPNASSNPELGKLTAGKKRLIILNKSDLADENATRRWCEKLSGADTAALCLDSRSKKGTGELYRITNDLIAEKRAKDRRKGITGERPVKAMVCGIPNVGKSTLINTLFGRSSAKTGNMPGVTKGNQWISTASGLLLLDTPGVLWPKFDDPQVGFLLASIGAINDSILDLQEVAVFLIRKMNTLYPGRIAERYGFTQEDAASCAASYEEEIPGVDYLSLAQLDLVAAERKYFKKGAVPDRDRAAKSIVDDLRAGRLGRVTLEWP